MIENYARITNRLSGLSQYKIGTNIDNLIILEILALGTYLNTLTLLFYL
jgi:hypothetical protein